MQSKCTLDENAGRRPTSASMIRASSTSRAPTRIAAVPSGRDVAEALAGRVAIVQLLGLSRREQDGSAAGHGPFLPMPDALAPRLADAPPLPLPELYRRIWRGAYPALTRDPELDRDLYFSSYVQTCLQRDVRDLARARCRPALRAAGASGSADRACQQPPLPLQ